MEKVIVLFLLFGFLVYLIMKIYKDKQKRVQEEIEAEERAVELDGLRKLIQEEHYIFLSNLKTKYGEITNQFEFRGLHGAIRQLYIFESSKIIIIAHKNDIKDIIPFSSILDFSVEKEDYQITSSGRTVISTTDTGSMITRGIAGGLIFGGLGAAVGAMTADRIFEMTEHSPHTFSNYSITITLDSIASPTYIMEFKGDVYTCKDVANILCIITKNRNSKEIIPDTENLRLTDMVEYRNGQGRDPLFEEVARLIVTSNTASTSYLQRRFSIAYNRAGKIMDQLEAAGIVGLAKGGKPRVVLVDSEQLEEILNS